MPFRAKPALAAFVCLLCAFTALLALRAAPPAASYDIPAAGTHRATPPMAVLETPNAGRALSIDSGLKDIKPCADATRNLRPIWLAAARTFKVRWQVLAAITKIESGFGCNMGPSSAGAIGWTQFLPSTWDRWGMDADGDGVADTANAVDAVFSTARYLRVTGAPGDYRKAIFAYNHAEWYVNDVLETAETFGEFNASEFNKLTALAGRGAKLQTRLDGLVEDLEHAEDRVHALKVRLASNRRQLRSGRRQVRALADELTRRQAELDRLTVRYIDFTQDIALSADTRPQQPDQAALEYLAGASEQDAALVYASAKAILDQQADVLAALRRASEETKQLKASVQSLVNANELAVTELSADLKSKVRAEREIRTKVRSARRALAAYTGVADDFRDLAGMDLSESPFAPGMDVNRRWSGPLRWPVNGAVSSGFSPNRCLKGVCRPHQGVDISVPTGTAVHASGDGTVSFAGTQSGYGSLVIIDHADGISTYYAHNSKIGVAVGDQVEQGDTIAASGCTGRCFGPHVHFETRRSGTPIDPWQIMPRRP